MKPVQQIFQAFSQLKVMVIGDVMVDAYLSGSRERMSPEAPVPILRQQSLDKRPGGAANVALNLRALGATPFLFGVTGDDTTGVELSQMLPAYNIDPQYLLQLPNRLTTSKTRVLAGDQQLIRIDHEQENPIDLQTEAQLIDAVKQLLKQEAMDVILLQDYNKGVLTSGLIAAVLDLAKRKHIPVAVDPKYDNFFEYRHVALFKPNLREVCAALNRRVISQTDSLEMAAAELRDRLGYQQCLITLGSDGIFIDDGGQTDLVNTHPRQVADVCGAGDTVIALASLCIALNLELGTIARLCNLAGGQVCEQTGVVPIDIAQLKKEWEQRLQI